MGAGCGFTSEGFFCSFLKILKCCQVLLFSLVSDRMAWVGRDLNDHPIPSMVGCCIYTGSIWDTYLMEEVQRKHLNLQS